MENDRRTGLTTAQATVLAALITAIGTAWVAYFTGSKITSDRYERKGGEQVDRYEKEITQLKVEIQNLRGQRAAQQQDRGTTHATDSEPREQRPSQAQVDNENRGTDVDN